MMEDEADSLRRQSHSGSQLLGEGMNPAFNFPAKPKPTNTKPTSKSKSSSKSKKVDSLQPLSAGDTPQMERNKLMREGKLPPSSLGVGDASGSNGGREGKGHTRRKSSMGGRGKRASGLIDGGVVCECL